MSLDEKSGEVKCGIQRQNKQKQKQKKACVTDVFFFKLGHKTFVMMLTSPCSFLLVCDDKSIWQSPTEFHSLGHQTQKFAWMQLY